MRQGGWTPGDGGAVCLKGVLSDEMIEVLSAGIDANIAQPSARGPWSNNVARPPVRGAFPVRRSGA
jgi:hypothetical protein